MAMVVMSLAKTDVFSGIAARLVTFEQVIEDAAPPQSVGQTRFASVFVPRAF